MNSRVAARARRGEPLQLPVEPSFPRAPAWAVLLVALQAIVTEIDFGLIGIPRFPVVFVTCMLPIPLLLLRAPGLFELTTRRPLRAMCAWLLWGMATTLWSVVPVTTARSSLAIACVFATGVWFSSTYGVARLVRVYTIAMTVFLTSGFIRDLVTVLDEDTVHRFRGFGFQATDVGRLALVTLVLSVIQIVERTARDVWTWSALGIATVTLVATGTRTTLIAAVICLFVISWRRLGIARTLMFGVAMVGAVVIATTIIPDPSDFVSREENAQDINSLNGRRTIWSVAIDITADRPIAGHGVESGELTFPLASARGELPILINHAHNLFLEITTTQGLVGLALFLGAIGSFLAARRAPGGDLSGVLLLAIVLGGVTEAALGRPTALYLVLAAIFAERAMAPERSSAD